MRFVKIGGRLERLVDLVRRRELPRRAPSGVPTKEVVFSPASSQVAPLEPHPPITPVSPISAEGERIAERLEAVVARLEPASTNEYGESDFPNVAVVDEGEDRIPVAISTYEGKISLYLGGRLLVLLSGGRFSIPLEAVDYNDFSLEDKRRLTNIVGALEHGLENPSAYREEIKPIIAGYYEREVRVFFPRRYTFTAEELEQRRQRVDALGKAAARSGSYLANNRPTIQEFVRIVLGLCRIFSPRDYPETQDGVSWEERLAGISKGSAFAEAVLGEAAYRGTLSGSVDPAQEKVDLAEAQRKQQARDHREEPIRNVFSVRVEGSSEEGHWLVIGSAPDSSSNQPFIEAYELLQNSGAPFRIDPEIRKWMLGDNLIERELGAARQLNVPDGEIKFPAGLTLGCGFRVKGEV